MPAHRFNVAPLSVFSAWHVLDVSVKSKAALSIKIVGEMYHIPVPSLEGPDGMIQVPYFSSQFDTVKEGEIFTGNGIEEFGLRYTG